MITSVFRLIVTLCWCAAIVLPTVSLGQSKDVEFAAYNFSDDPNGLMQALGELESGDALYNAKGNYFNEALNHYVIAYGFNPNNALLNMKIGRCYLELLELEDALYYLDAAYDLNPNVDGYLYFLHARVYHLQKQWDKAIDKYEAFRNKALMNPEVVEAVAKHFKLTNDMNVVREFILRKIEECETGHQLMASQAVATVGSIGEEINSMKHDFRPLVTADGTHLIFNSRRQPNRGRAVNDDGEFYADAYSSHNEDREWSEAINLPGKVNEKKDDFPVYLDEFGYKMLLVRDGDIYQVEQVGKVWQKPTKLKGEVNSKYNETSAWLVDDGNVIFFTSDRPGGQGGLDVYMSLNTPEDEWQTPVNLGKMVNSPLDENGVFVSEDGNTMYLISKGHTSMGGYDVFRTFFSERDSTWSEMENLGAPINSPFDEGPMVFGDNPKRGYYSAIQEDGMGGTDIHVVNFEHNALRPKAEVMITIEGVVADYNGNFVQAEITCVDEKTGKLVSRVYSNASSGNYDFAIPSGRNYQICIAAAGCVPYAEKLRLPWVAETRSIFKDVDLQNLAQGEIGEMRSEMIFKPGRDQFSDNAEQSLNALYEMLQVEPSLIVDIVGHTHDNGDAVFNQQLSQRQAAAVMKWLLDKGIERNRVTSRGKGDAEPLDNSASRSGRRLNNRMEFEVKSYSPTAKPVLAIKEDVRPGGGEDHVALKVEGEFKKVGAEGVSESPQSVSQPEPAESQPKSSIPDLYQPADINNDGYISSAETYAAIDAFFEGEIPLTLMDLYGLLDFFFEQ